MTELDIYNADELVAPEWMGKHSFDQSPTQISDL